MTLLNSYLQNTARILKEEYTRFAKGGAKSHITKFGLIYMVVAFVMLTLNAYQLYLKYETHEKLQQEEINKLLYWEEVISQHPNFPDAYYNAALVAYRLDMKNVAQGYLDTAVTLDPGFSDAMKLMEQIY